MDVTRPRMRRSLLMCLAAQLVTAHASAAGGELELEPSFSASELYSDNLALVGDHDAVAGFVTLLSPAIHLFEHRPGLQARLDYSLLEMHDSRTESGFHSFQRLAAEASLNGLDQRLALDAKVRAYQVPSSSLGPTGSADPSVNSSTVRTAEITPSWRQPLGDGMRGSVALTAAHAASDVPGVFDANTEGFRAGVESWPEVRPVDWSLSGAWSRQVSPALAQPAELRTVVARVRWRLDGNWRTRLEAGYEHNDFPVLGRRPQGGLAALGVEWAPDHLANAQLAVGHRYFGTTLDASVHARSRRAVLDARYAESLQTTQFAFANPQQLSTYDYLNGALAEQLPDPAQRTAYIRNLLANGLPTGLNGAAMTLTNLVYLDKTADLSLFCRGARSHWIVRMFHTLRESQGVPQDPLLLAAAGDLARNSRVMLAGLQFDVNWRLDARASLDAGWSLSRVDFRGLGRTDTTQSLSTTASYALAPRAQLSFTLRHQLRTSTDVNSGYHENAAIAAIAIPL
jgi:uncharacterized protein (PEP-CTERM system associated)